MEEILKDENPTENEAIQEYVKQINLKEAECFDRVFKRFCWLNGVAIDISKVDYVVPDQDNRPNFWEYYYVGKIPKASGTYHLLMSREVVLIDGKPTLEVKFNPILLEEKDV